MNKEIKRRRNNRSSIVVATVLLLLLIVSVGYAALITRLDINGTTNITKNSWNVYIESVSNIKSSGSTVETTPPVIESGSTFTTILTYDVTLGKPGDYYQFDFTVKNGGSIDIKLSELPILSGLTSAQDVYVNHIITDASNREVTVSDSVIEAGQTKTYRIKVMYDTNITDTDLPTVDQSISLKAQLNYIQK